MSVEFRHLKLYVRAGLTLVLAVAVGLVLLKNRSHAVPFWFFGLTDDTRPVNVIFLMLCTAGGTLLTWWVLSRARGIWRDMREFSRLRDVGRAARKLEQRAAELDKRERRIDQKLQHAISEEEDVGEE